MSEKVWYVAVDGQQSGSMSAEEIRQGVQAGTYDASTYVFTEGMANWEPLSSRPELASALGGGSPQPTIPPPAPSAGTTTAAHEIDYEIHGHEMQFVEITLDPGEACIAEAGGFMYMDPGIELETIFGDGSAADSAGGFMGKLMGAGKRLLTGESLFMTVFGNSDSRRRKVAFASPYPGGIVPLDLAQHGGKIICQKDAFLAAAKGISVGIELQRKIAAGFFGGEGFILQKLEGDGLAFVHAGGAIVERELEAGETLRLDTGCLVAFEATVDYDIQSVKGIKTFLFAGEGLFYAALTGPGKIWMQSLPFSRLAGRVLASVPRGGKRRKGEGSALGDLGELFMGD